MPTSPPDDWCTPGTYAIAPGVYRIPLPLPNDGLRAVNVYVIAGNERLVCIDSGWAIAGARQVFLEALATLECGFEDIDRFLITHVHRDHYTQAITLRREFSTPVSLGRGERLSLDTILQPGRSPLEARLSHLRLNGAAALAEEFAVGRAANAEPTDFEWELPDDWLEEGVVALSDGRLLDVVETPGHTRGHVVFYDPTAALLFAGDHVLPTITPSIGFEPAISPNPLRDFLASLARVRQLPDAMLLPAHGAVAPSVHARVDELVDHHGRRLEHTLAAVAAGAGTAFEVAAQLLWTRRERRLGELDLFNQSLAISETAAHLALLVAQGRVRRTLEEGVFRYGE
ncbi:MAG TPA: MBL fold metallo-hydrolase [Acidimicrobiales bacterium]|jgi:glyoxylase-like metal-dependent hydrolase (beta-lactamase superfamily II)|nr:MBL fold metallo-hydrolase [Acidimicrobiales bacterium]